MVIDPADPAQNRWYAGVWGEWGSSSGHGGLYVTTNRGVSWTRRMAGYSVGSCTPSPLNSNELYVTTEQDGLWVSTNCMAASPTFTSCAEYPFRFPSRVFFNPSNAREVWVTSYGNGLRMGLSDALDVTSSSGPNGTISPLGKVWVVTGAAASFVITPAAHHHVTNVIVDGLSIGPTNAYSFTNVTTGGHTIHALFGVDRYTLNVTSAYGSPSPSGLTTNDWNAIISASGGPAVQAGASTQFVCVAWTGSGSATNGKGTNTSFAITNDSTLAWQWQTQYLVTATAGTYGAVSPTGGTWVFRGSNSPAFTATPQNSCAVRNWTVNGAIAQTGGTNFSSTNVANAIWVGVSFDALPSLGLLTNRSVLLGQGVTIEVSATDPDGTIPTLAATTKPVGASFIDHGNGTGVFTWSPASPSDLGSHTVVFVATAGPFSTTGQLVVVVSSFSVGSPVTGAKVRVGDPLSIAWTGSWPLGAVDVELWKGTNLVSVLTNGLASSTSNMTWVALLGPPISRGTDYWVSVTDSDNPADSALSGTFTIINAGLSWLLLLMGQ